MPWCLLKWGKIVVEFLHVLSPGLWGGTLGAGLALVVYSLSVGFPFPKGGPKLEQGEQHDMHT
jgi:hypothetical protein